MARCPSNNPLLSPAKCPRRRPAACARSVPGPRAPAGPSSSCARSCAAAAPRSAVGVRRGWGQIKSATTPEPGEMLQHCPVLGGADLPLAYRPWTKHLGMESSWGLYISCVSHTVWRRNSSLGPPNLPIYFPHHAPWQGKQECPEPFPGAGRQGLLIKAPDSPNSLVSMPPHCPLQDKGQGP